MTDDELKAIEVRAMTEEQLAKIEKDYPWDPPRELVAEVRRLREVERRHDALYAHFADVHRALGKHDDKTLTAAGSVRKLVADNERLRGLVKAAELAADTANVACACPWCGSMIQEPHEADCPAFHPDGTVR